MEPLINIDTFNGDVGNKGEGLKLAKALGLHIPATFLVMGIPTAEAIWQAVGIPAILRSSGTSEDSLPGVCESSIVLSMDDAVVRHSYNTVKRSGPQNQTMHVLLQQYIQTGLYGVFVRGNDDICSVSDFSYGATRGVGTLESPFESFSKSEAYSFIADAASRVSQIFDAFELEWVLHREKLYILQLRSIKLDRTSIETDKCGLRGFSVGSGVFESTVVTPGCFSEGKILFVDTPDDVHEPLMLRSLAVVAARGTATSHLAMRVREAGSCGLFGIGSISSFSPGQEVRVVLNDLGAGSVVHKGV